MVPFHKLTLASLDLKVRCPPRSEVEGGRTLFPLPADEEGQCVWVLWPFVLSPLFFPLKKASGVMQETDGDEQGVFRTVW